MSITDSKIKKVRDTLFEHEEEIVRKSERGNWDFLKEAYQKKRQATKQEANEFLLGASLQRRQQAETVWDNARKLLTKLKSSPYYKNSPDLWSAILNVPKKEWLRWWREGKYHIYGEKSGELVYRTADLIVKEYGGDARNIWNLKNGKDKYETLLHRLRELHGVGPNIANMIIGALRDTKQINLKYSEVKVDVHVCRVLSRVFLGEGQTPEQFGDKAINLTQKMHPKDPWQFDRTLFRIGRGYCKSNYPLCDGCPLDSVCNHSHKYYE